MMLRPESRRDVWTCGQDGIHRMGLPIKICLNLRDKASHIMVYCQVSKTVILSGCALNACIWISLNSLQSRVFHHIIYGSECYK